MVVIFLMMMMVVVGGVSGWWHQGVPISHDSKGTNTLQQIVTCSDRLPLSINRKLEIRQQLRLIWRTLVKLNANDDWTSKKTFHLQSRCVRRLVCGMRITGGGVDGNEENDDDDEDKCVASTSEL